MCILPKRFDGKTLFNYFRKKLRKPWIFFLPRVRGLHRDWLFCIIMLVYHTRQLLSFYSRTLWFDFPQTWYFSRKVVVHSSNQQRVSFIFNLYYYFQQYNVLLLECKYIVLYNKFNPHTIRARSCKSVSSEDNNLPIIISDNTVLE